jgi:putative MATE family efflux protein
MLSQSLLNLVDTAMVGRLGETALAGVGLGGYASYVASSWIMGTGAAVQAMIARRAGEQHMTQIAQPLNAALLATLLLATPVMLMLWTASPLFMALLTQDPEVRQQAGLYFSARVLGMVAIGWNFSFRGYWNGTGHSHVYMGVLVFMHLCNVLISYSLIFGKFGLPELGVQGAGIGTTVSLYLGSLLYARLTWRDRPDYGFLRHFPGMESYKSLLRLSIPNGIQQLSFAAGFAVFFALIARIGSAEVAVAHILTTLALFMILPGIGLGMAAATLAGKSLGNKAYAEAHRWGWEVVCITLLMLAILGTPLWIMPDAVIHVFTDRPHLVDMAHLPLQLTALWICLDAMGIVLMQALLGVGASRTVMLVSVVTQWGLLLPIVWFAVTFLDVGLLFVWASFGIQRALNSMIFGWIWFRQRWLQIQL